MSISESYYCPLSGDKPDRYAPRYEKERTGNCILIPGKFLPGETTDAQAEHERALMGAFEWSRSKEGRIILWADM